MRFIARYLTSCQYRFYENRNYRDLADCDGRKRHWIKTKYQERIKSQVLDIKGTKSNIMNRRDMRRMTNGVGVAAAQNIALFLKNKNIPPPKRRRRFRVDHHTLVIPPMNLRKLATHTRTRGSGRQNPEEQRPHEQFHRVFRRDVRNPAIQHHRRIDHAADLKGRNRLVERPD